MYKTLHEYRFSKDIDDIRGSVLYDLKGEELGTIEDVIFDQNTSQILYFIIDTGGWLRSRRFLVPPEQLRPMAEQGDKLAITLTKQQIERFPAFDKNLLEQEEKFREYETEYRSSWINAPERNQSGDSPKGEIPSQSPLSARFLKFQEEIARKREDFSRRPAENQNRQPSTKAG